MADLSDDISIYVPSLSLQNDYTVYALLTTEDGESVTTELTYFSKLHEIILIDHQYAYCCYRYNGAISLCCKW